MKVALFIILFFVALIGCKKEKTIAETYPLTGNYYGTMRYASHYGYHDSSGNHVQIIDTSYSSIASVKEVGADSILIYIGTDKYKFLQNSKNIYDIYGPGEYDHGQCQFLGNDSLSYIFNHNIPGYIATYFDSQTYFNGVKK